VVHHAVRGQVTHHRDGLDRLAEPHFVAEDDSPLRQDEPGAEGLVSTQSQVLRQAGGVQRLRVDPFDDVGRQEALGRGVPAQADSLTEQAVVLHRTPFEVAPDLLRAGHLDVADVVCRTQQTAGVRVLQPLPDPRRGRVGLGPFPAR
jgi:hypothetical protein